jgi:ABC-2 type transport system permease protein
MRRLKFLIVKEFLQIFRNKAMLPLMFVMPLIQLLILSNAATYEIKHLNIAIVDKEQSSFSRELISKFQGSNYFIIAGLTTDTEEAERMIQKREADLYIEIPDNIEKQLVRENSSKINMVVNAIDGAKASIGAYYAYGILQDFMKDEVSKFAMKTNLITAPQYKEITVLSQNWFNPELDYKTFMVPGILVLLVTMIGTFLSALNIVREKEIGTIDSLNVTPTHKFEFIIAKIIPIWLIGLTELTFGLLLSRFIFNVPLLGSPVVLFVFAMLYLLVALGMGLFISTTTETQQQAMFFVWFFMMLFILLSGLFTAIENMPVWAQKITLFNPVRYFIEVVRMVMLKGAGFREVSHHFLVIGIMAVAVNTLAIIRYRKTT